MFPPCCLVYSQGKDGNWKGYAHLVSLNISLSCMTLGFRHFEVSELLAISAATYAITLSNGSFDHQQLHLSSILLLNSVFTYAYAQKNNHNSAAVLCCPLAPRLHYCIVLNPDSFQLQHFTGPKSTQILKFTQLKKMAKWPI